MAFQNDLYKFATCVLTHYRNDSALGLVDEDSIAKFIDNVKFYILQLFIIMINFFFFRTETVY